MYKYLKSLPEDDSFWGQNIGEYNKQSCFRDYPNISENKNIEEYKDWFKAQKPYWGNANNRLYKRWAENNKNELVNFIKKFTEKLKKKQSVYSKEIGEIESNLLKNIEK